MMKFDWKQNTDSDWEKIGRSNPYWGVLTSDMFLNENLTDEAKENFFTSGEKEVERIANYFNCFNGQKLNTVLDFGSGTGRLVIPMSKYAHKTIAIEIADSMTDELIKNCEYFNIRNISIYKTIDDLLLMDQQVALDWINSYIVFQHISSERGYIILEKMLKLLNIGGCISLHFSIFNDAVIEKDKTIYQQIDSTTVKILEGDKTNSTLCMFDYDINKIYYLFQKYGIEEFFCKSENHGHYGEFHTLRFFGQRNKFTHLQSSNQSHIFLRELYKWSEGVVDISGFSIAESWGTWTNSSEAFITFYVNNDLIDKELKMSLLFRVFGTQTIQIYANSLLVAEYQDVKGEALKREMIIPPIIKKANHRLTVKFVVSNPIPPSEMDGSGDLRELGIGILDLHISAL